MRIAISPHQPEYAGRTIDDIARSRSCDPLDAACDDLIADRGHTRILVTSMAETDVQEIVRSPTVLVGSDGTSLAPYAITGRASRTRASTAPSPACWATMSASWGCSPCPRRFTR